MNIQVVALDLVSKGAVTPKELSKVTGVTYLTARENLMRLENAGKLKRKGQKLVFTKA